MVKKILKRVFGVLVKINEWIDKDADKEVYSVISGIIILLAILILKKPVLFVFVLIVIVDRVLHRFNIWKKLEEKVDEEEYDSTLSE